MPHAPRYYPAAQDTDGPLHSTNLFNDDASDGASRTASLVRPFRGASEEHPAQGGSEDPLDGVLDWLSHADGADVANWLRPWQQTEVCSEPSEDPMADLLDWISRADEDDELSWVDIDGSPSGGMRSGSVSRGQPHWFPSEGSEAAMNQDPHPWPPPHAPHAPQPQPVQRPAWKPTELLRDVNRGAAQPLTGRCRNGAAPQQQLSEEEERVARQRLTGAIGRLVSYGPSTIAPSDDICGLRVTPSGRVIVTAVLEHGPAAAAGITIGDELVSINGRKDFCEAPASTILLNLRLPVMLVFMGFVGKVQAEVRVKHMSTTPCGMPSGAHIISGAQVELCEAVIFQPSSTSMLIATSDEQVINRTNGGRREAMYELQREEARDILHLALTDDGLLSV
eukprot:NODE_8493_length_1491_cov_13.612170.p1 GENE.NODE_8493_length_1491_cov_13.612170~~NODE_8493_length_1491_cov_13.612170.p1  ORF type:complete len:394 (+),score=101.37 NODE_8493_length_1491_cov_13.612170:174-1355(+)